MRILVSRPSRAGLAGCAAVVALAAPGSALAAPVSAELRVEAAHSAFAAGSSFVTDSVNLTTDTSPACGGSGKSVAVSGPTALGLVQSAADASARVRPLQVSDKFSFGLLVCGIAGRTATDSAFWLYKVNHVSPEVGGDQYSLKAGDQVLWYLQDTSNGINAGDELAIEAPARATSGQGFEVEVVRYDFKGARSPAAGARVLFEGGEAVAGPDGKAQINSSGTGLLRLRAVRANPSAGGGDIPSAPVNVCLAERPSACPAVRGKRITGLDVADVLAGTQGPDVIRSRGGADRLDVRGGGTDRVYCGSGRDRVRLDRRDRAARDCEIVRRG